MLPSLDADGYLPIGIHPASLSEIRERFVDDAPFGPPRERIFRALELHVEIVVQRLGPGARLWVDGGFATHKEWAAPKDVDLAYFVPLTQALRAREPDMLELWTTQGVSVAKPRIEADRVQPMGGLVDAFFTVEMPAQIEVWRDTWSRVKGPDGEGIPDRRKGFLEVVL